MDPLLALLATAALHGTTPAIAREQIGKLLEEAVAALPNAFPTVFVLRQMEQRGNARGARHSTRHHENPSIPALAAGCRELLAPELAQS